MRNTLKRLVALALTIVMCISVLQMNVFAVDDTDSTEQIQQTETTDTGAEDGMDSEDGEVEEDADSKTCGDALIWELSEGGTLTISGTGAMSDFTSNTIPWRDCKDQIVEVVVEAGVASIGSSAFENCIGLVEITIPASVTGIGGNAFNGCTALTAITFEGTAPAIGENAFGGVTAKAYYIPGDTWTEDVMQSYGGEMNWSYEIVSNQQMIGNYGGYVNIYWSLLTDGTLILTGTGDTPFYSFASAVGWHSYRDQIKYVIVEEGITSINNYAFMDCANLTTVELPDGFKSFGFQAFDNCSSLCDITFPDSVTTFGSYAFRYCTALTSVIFPESLKTVGFHAFYGCTGLTGNLRIPSSVTSIDTLAFSGCAALTSVTFVGDAPNIDDHAFSNVTAEIYYPETNDTWIDEVRLNYGGSLTWVPIPDSVRINVQPVSVTGIIGETLRVWVEAVGERLTYQWYIRNSTTGGWTKSSITTNVYEVVMNQSRTYRELYCIITDANGNTLKTDVVTMIGQPDQELKILTQPTDASAKLGENYCVTVEAQGDGLKYQWYWRNPGQTNWNTSGVKDNTYDDVMTTSRAGREVYCVITDAWGNDLTTDTVTLIGLPQVELAIVTQPTDVSAKLGERFVVAVEAQGDDLRYAWYWRQIGDERWNISGQRDNTYDAEMNASRHNREVYCVITDAFGNTVTSDVATITGTPTVSLEITRQPENQSVTLGDMFNVTFEAQGDDLRYQWYFRKAGTDTWIHSSQKDNCYDDVMTENRHNRELCCVITDAWGNSVTTDIATLVGIPEVELSIVTQPTDASAKIDEQFVVTVEAQGDSLKYQWYWRNIGSETWNVSGERDNTYDAVMTKARHNREVYCVITDMWGDSVTTNVVAITAIPDEVLAIVTQPTDASVAMGENYCVTVEAQGDGLKYQWYFKNAGSDVWHISGVRDNTYDDVMIASRAGREVYCVITDIWGNSVTTVTVTLACTEELRMIPAN